MKQSFFFFLTVILFFGCSDSPGSQPETITGTAKDSVVNKDFLPVTDYVGGELKMIDSLQLPITKTIIIDKKEEIYPLQSAELLQLANEFLKPDINDTTIKNFYKETSLADQSSGTINFVYTTNNPDLEIQRLDVNLKGDPVLNDKVNSIYIEKFTKAADTGITKRLLWKAGKNFQIITEKRLGARIFPRQTVKVTWDPTE